MDLIIFGGFTLLGFFLGFMTMFIIDCYKKTDGRLVINKADDEYFVAITAKPEILAKKRRLYLRVITK